MQKNIQKLLDNNKKWAERINQQDNQYFRNLSQLQTPQFLWIGCADSRVPADQITDLRPGEVFVHRNVANIVHPADLNFLSVLQYAIEVLRVRFVIVCGHYGCGGIAAAVDGIRHGTIDHWLQPIRDIAELHESEMASCESRSDRNDLLCELNVRYQVKRVAQTPIVQDAWKNGQELEIHGWIYRLIDGILHPLIMVDKHGLPGTNLYK